VPVGPPLPLPGELSTEKSCSTFDAPGGVARPSVESAVGAPDCADPSEPVDVFPPPTCTAPVELPAELPEPGTPAVRPTVDDSPPLGVAVAAGDAVTPLTWAVPVELDELLPPPICTAPVELDALLLPAPTAAGADAVNELVPVDRCARGRVEKGEDCTAPVDREDVLAPPPFDVDPPGTAAVMPPKGDETPTAGSAVTLPICTTPVESDAVLPVSAIAGAAATSAAHVAVTATRDLDRMSISSRFLCRTSRNSTQAAPIYSKPGETQSPRASPARLLFLVCRCTPKRQRSKRRVL
jgi:hypothetical protein